MATDLDFITSTLKATFGLGLLGLALVGFYFGFPHGLAVFAGASWGCLNLIFIGYLMKGILAASRFDFVQVLALIGLKFPGLYLMGYGLLCIDYLPKTSLIAGSTLIFAVIFLRGLGRVVLKKA